MLLGKKILAVVPARSGSKGIPDKNICSLAGTSLIGWAGICLSKLDWIDSKILSTDSAEYANEGVKFGLSAPFLRPKHLSTDTAGAVETITHALLEAEKYYSLHFDIVLIIEPTSPLRTAEDIENAALLLVKAKADSVVCVSELSMKAHPLKVLKVVDDKLMFYDEKGSSITARQSLEGLYWRNGVCYALTRDCLLENKKIFTENSRPLVIKREIVNIDEPIDLEWAEFLIQRGSKKNP